MGLLAYATVLIAGAAVYSSYSVATTDEGSHIISNLLGVASVLFGAIFGLLSIINGEFVSGGVAILAGIIGVGVAMSVTVFGFVKEDPEAAAAAASAVAQTAAVADEVSNSGQSVEREPEQKITVDGEPMELDAPQVKQVLKSAQFSMNCTGCGQTLAYGDRVMQNGSRVGYTRVGYNSTLDRTEIQCTECGTTKKVDGEV
jgi:hypothetical protein